MNSKYKKPSEHFLYEYQQNKLYYIKLFEMVNNNIPLMLMNSSNKVIHDKKYNNTYGDKNVYYNQYGRGYLDSDEDNLLENMINLFTESSKFLDVTALTCAFMKNVSASDLADEKNYKDFCNATSLKLSTILIKDVIEHVFHIESQFIVELIANGFDSQNIQNKKVGRFGVGFFSSFIPLLKNKEGVTKVLKLSTRYQRLEKEKKQDTPQEKKTKGYILTLKFIDKNLVFRFDRLPSDDTEDEPGTTISYEATNNSGKIDILSNEEIDMLTSEIRRFYLYSSGTLLVNIPNNTKIITDELTKLRNKTYKIVKLNNTEYININDSNNTSRVCVTITNNTLTVSDYGIGIDIKIALGKLLVPSSSDKGMLSEEQDKKESVDVLNIDGKSGLIPSYDDSSHILITVNGVNILDISEKIKDTKPMIVWYDLPHNWKLPIARNDIILNNHDGTLELFIKHTDKIIQNILINDKNIARLQILINIYKLKSFQTLCLTNIADHIIDYLQKYLSENINILPFPIFVDASHYGIMGNTYIFIELIKQDGELLFVNNVNYSNTINYFVTKYGINTTDVLSHNTVYVKTDNNLVMTWNGTLFLSDSVKNNVQKRLELMTTLDSGYLLPISQNDSRKTYIQNTINESEKYLDHERYNLISVVLTSIIKDLITLNGANSRVLNIINQKIIIVRKYLHDLYNACRDLKMIYTNIQFENLPAFFYYLATLAINIEISNTDETPNKYVLYENNVKNLFDKYKVLFNNNDISSKIEHVYGDSDTKYIVFSVEHPYLNNDLVDVQYNKIHKYIRETPFINTNYSDFKYNIQTHFSRNKININLQINLTDDYYDLNSMEYIKKYVNLSTLDLRTDIYIYDRKEGKFNTDNTFNINKYIIDGFDIKTQMIHQNEFIKLDDNTQQQILTTLNKYMPIEYFLEMCVNAYIKEQAQQQAQKDVKNDNKKTKKDVKNEFDMLVIENKNYLNEYNKLDKNKVHAKQVVEDKRVKEAKRRAKWIANAVRTKEEASKRIAKWKEEEEEAKRILHANWTDKEPKWIQEKEAKWIQEKKRRVEEEQKWNKEVKEEELKQSQEAKLIEELEAKQTEALLTLHDYIIFKKADNFNIIYLLDKIELLKYAFYTDNDNKTFCYRLFKIHCDNTIKHIYQNYNYIFDNIDYIKESLATFEKIRDNIQTKSNLKSQDNTETVRFIKLIKLIHNKLAIIINMKKHYNNVIDTEKKQQVQQAKQIQKAQQIQQVQQAHIQKAQQTRQVQQAHIQKVQQIQQAQQARIQKEQIESNMKKYNRSRQNDDSDDGFSQTGGNMDKFPIEFQIHLVNAEFMYFSLDYICNKWETIDNNQIKTKLDLDIKLARENHYNVYNFPLTKILFKLFINILILKNINVNSYAKSLNFYIDIITTYANTLFKYDVNNYADEYNMIPLFLYSNRELVIAHKSQYPYIKKLSKLFSSKPTLLERHISKSNYVMLPIFLDPLILLNTLISGVTNHKAKLMIDIIEKFAESCNNMIPSYPERYFVTLLLVLLSIFEFGKNKIIEYFVNSNKLTKRINTNTLFNIFIDLDKINVTEINSVIKIISSNSISLIDDFILDYMTFLYPENTDCFDNFTNLKIYFENITNKKEVEKRDHLGNYFYRIQNHSLVLMLKEYFIISISKSSSKIDTHTDFNEYIKTLNIGGEKKIDIDSIEGLKLSKLIKEVFLMPSTTDKKTISFTDVITLIKLQDTYSVEKKSEQTELQLSMIAINSGSTNQVELSVATEVLQNSIDIIDEHHNIRNWKQSVNINNFKVHEYDFLNKFKSESDIKIDVNISALVHDGKYSILYKNTDYIGFQDYDNIMSLVIPYYSSKKSGTGMMGNGFFNCYRRSDNVLVRSKNKEKKVNFLIKDITILDHAKNLVVDVSKDIIKYEPSDINKNNTSIVIKYKDTNKTDYIIQVMNLRTELFNIMSSVPYIRSYINNTNITPKVVLLYSSDILKIFSNKNKMIKSFVLTNGVPFISLIQFNDQFKMFPPNFLSFIEFGMILDINPSKYKPVQSRVNIILEKDLQEEIKKEIPNALYIKLLLNMILEESNITISNYHSTLISINQILPDFDDTPSPLQNYKTISTFIEKYIVNINGNNISIAKRIRELIYYFNDDFQINLCELLSTFDIKIDDYARQYKKSYDSKCVNKYLNDIHDIYFTILAYTDLLDKTIKNVKIRVDGCCDILIIIEYYSLNWIKFKLTSIDSNVINTFNKYSTVYNLDIKKMIELKEDKNKDTDSEYRYKLLQMFANNYQNQIKNIPVENTNTPLSSVISASNMKEQNDDTNSENNIYISLFINSYIDSYIKILKHKNIINNERKIPIFDVLQIERTTLAFYNKVQNYIAINMNSSLNVHLKNLTKYGIECAEFINTNSLYNLIIKLHEELPYKKFFHVLFSGLNGSSIVHELEHYRRGDSHKSISLIPCNMDGYNFHGSVIVTFNNEPECEKSFDQCIMECFIEAKKNGFINTWIIDIANAINKLKTYSGEIKL